MNTTEDRYSILFSKLQTAKRTKNTSDEIDALLHLGNHFLDTDDADNAHLHFDLAKKVMSSNAITDRLHWALGGIGRCYRRKRRFTDAIEAFRQASAAATKRSHVVKWKLGEAAALGATGDKEKSQEVINEARNTLLPPHPGPMSFLSIISSVDCEELEVVAELEGQTGLMKLKDGDEAGAEEAYSRALHFAKRAYNIPAIVTWATNLANAKLRRNLAGEAIEIYQGVAEVCVRANDLTRLKSTVKRSFDVFHTSYRYDEGATWMERLSRTVDDQQMKKELLMRAHQLADIGRRKTLVIRLAKKLLRMLSKETDRGLVDALERQITGLQKSEEKKKPTPEQSKLTPYEYAIVHWMAEAQRTGNPAHALEAAHLVCDVRMALYTSGKEPDKKLAGLFVNGEGLDVRVFHEAIEILLKNDQEQHAMELLQRFKGISFAASALSMKVPGPRRHKQFEEYEKTLRELQRAAKKILGPGNSEWRQHVNTVRRSGQTLLECCELIRQADYLANARIGGLVTLEELTDSLPYVDPIAIVDFVTTSKGTFGLIYVREAEGIRRLALHAATFTAEVTKQLFEIFAQFNISKSTDFNRRQQGLHHIAKLLHDHFFCQLAKTLSSRGIVHLILIPDMLTRFLPLHLAYVCGAEIQVRGVDTEGARYLCETMPIDYAPCLQSVVLNQLQLRPTISSIAAFADPFGDLPSTVILFEKLQKDAGQSVDFKVRAGKRMTSTNVRRSFANADIIAFGTHGIVASDAMKSCLRLADKDWTLKEMLDLPSFSKHPLIVLGACEIGAYPINPNTALPSGIPGVLLAGGASSVLANLWPMEEVSLGYMLSQLFHYLSHAGYRPSAALFRVVRDMRRMKREDVLALYRNRVKEYKDRGVAARAILSAENFADWLEEQDIEYPFSSPIFWGAATITGSGWHFPARGLVGSPAHTMKIMLDRNALESMMVRHDYHEAKSLAIDLMQRTDGEFKGKTMLDLAVAMVRDSDHIFLDLDKTTAMKYVQKAEAIAHNTKNKQLLDSARKVRQWMRAYN